jgi:hypothetical protein
VFELIRSTCVAVVRGNHDHYVAYDECLEDFHPLAASVIDWTRKQLTREQIQYLRNLRLIADGRWVYDRAQYVRYAGALGVRD